MPSPIDKDTWIQVSPSALCHNIDAVRAHLASAEKPPRIIAVVKANGFGHGIAEAARVFQDAGVDFFGVTTLAEAITLREAGITGSILIFLPPRPDQIAAALSYDLTITVCDGNLATLVGQGAVTAGKVASVHLKVDTGMGRLGVLPAYAVAAAREIVQQPGLHLEGIYTHFARALDKEWPPTQRQLDTFLKVIEQIKQGGIDPGLRHCANSAALLRSRDTWLDAVRPGTILYGQYPSAAVPRDVKLNGATWRMQTRIIAVRDVPTGTAVGYGGEFVTRRATRLAVIPVGYADGFTVAPASVTTGWRGARGLLKGLMPGAKGLCVTVRGQQAPVVGRVAMQITSVDVTDIPGVTVGDIVTVPARRIMANASLPRIYEDW